MSRRPFSFRGIISGRKLDKAQLDVALGKQGFRQHARDKATQCKDARDRPKTLSPLGDEDSTGREGTLYTLNGWAAGRDVAIFATCKCANASHIAH